MPQVSVLMPCYNSAATLEVTLDSLAAQTLQEYELVAVDDGSTDDTYDILQQRADRDNRIHIISTPHRGIVAALNTGLENCHAQYVARMDSDDRAHPDRLKKQVSYLEEHPDVAVVSCLVTAFPPHQVREGFQVYIDWVNSLVDDADIRREIFIESPLPHPSVTYRRELVQAVGGYQDHGWAEDYDLWLRLFLGETRFAKIPEVLLDWREDPNRLTRTHSRYSLQNFLKAKAFYLSIGPLVERDSVIIWGAGMTGRRLSKLLLRRGTPIIAFIDIDPKKMGRTKHGLPIYPPSEIENLWGGSTQPALISAVGARNARPLIRKYLQERGLIEASDWWFAA